MTINGTAVEANLQAFRLGRIAIAAPSTLHTEPKTSTASDALSYFRQTLEAYQDAALVTEFDQVLEAVGDITQAWGLPSDVWQKTVAASLFRLLRQKDEYEVARLFSQPDVLARADLRLYMVPPWRRRRIEKTTDPRSYKMPIGKLWQSFLPILASFRRIRGRWYDPLRYRSETRQQQKILQDYRQLLNRLPELFAQNPAEKVLAVLALPQQIRGYGHIRQQAIQSFQAEWKSKGEALFSSSKPP